MLGASPDLLAGGAPSHVWARPHRARVRLRRTALTCGSVAPRSRAAPSHRAHVRLRRTALTCGSATHASSASALSGLRGRDSPATRRDPCGGAAKPCGGADACREGSEAATPRSLAAPPHEPPRHRPSAAASGATRRRHAETCVAESRIRVAEPRGSPRERAGQATKLATSPGSTAARTLALISSDMGGRELSGNHAASVFSPSAGNGSPLT